jgi:ribose transport system permease protein
VANIKDILEKFRPFIPFIGLLLVVLFFQIASDGLLMSMGNFPIFINYAFSITAVSCGAVFLMAQGNLDFSVAANICVTAAITAQVSQFSIPLAIMAALVCGAVIGAVNSFVHIVLGISSFIATLATSFVFTGVANLLLGSGSKAADYGMKNLDNLPLKLSVLVVVCLITYLVLDYSPFGKQCKAIGSREEVARQSGVNIKLKKAIPFVITGFACGIAAIFSIVRTCTASTQTGISMQINVMLALLLGGIPFSGGWAARFRGALIGSLIMAVVTNGLVIMGVPVLTQEILKGILFVLAVAVSFDRKNAIVIK